MSGRTLVAGVGNIFLSDDAFGVEVVRLLSERPVPAGVERGPEPDVREHVPVGAYGRQDDVHAAGSGANSSAFGLV